MWRRVRNFGPTTILALLLDACTAQPGPGPVPVGEPGEMRQKDSLDYRKVLESLQDSERLQAEVEWQKSVEEKSLNLQGLISSARQYEKILDTIIISATPDQHQLACARTLRALHGLILAAEQQLEVRDDLTALASTELALDRTLVEAKGCVVGYGEVVYVYFKLDDRSDDMDGRSVPDGLNPAFAAENLKVFDKILATCSRAGVIHLYGYSCDLGSDLYNETLAYDRARNLERYVSEMIAAACGPTGILLKAHLGGIIRLVDPEGKEADLLEYQREQNRVVALFLYNQG